jgi:hypothetical protein
MRPAVAPEKTSETSTGYPAILQHDSLIHYVRSFPYSRRPIGGLTLRR